MFGIPTVHNSVHLLLCIGENGARMGGTSSNFEYRSSHLRCPDHDRVKTSHHYGWSNFLLPAFRVVDRRLRMASRNSIAQFFCVPVDPICPAYYIVLIHENVMVWRQLTETGNIVNLLEWLGRGDKKDES